MNRILDYIFAAVMTLLLVYLVEKFMTNLEITEELTLFMFASIYLNFINLMNNHDLNIKMKVNQFLNAQLLQELYSKERCQKAVEKIAKENKLTL